MLNNELIAEMLELLNKYTTETGIKVNNIKTHHNNEDGYYGLEVDCTVLKTSRILIAPSDITTDENADKVADEILERYKRDGAIPPTG